jgi:nitroimidazol reductase NimA-like FMN-containing flavoprotein (pyridoxamine 5'-phosphate oxidase superfamily)
MKGSVLVKLFEVSVRTKRARVDMDEILRTERTTVHRMPARAAYDRSLIYAILDQSLICHVGFLVDGRPFVIPTIHVRVGDRLYIHGSRASRMQKVLAGGGEVCVTVTLVDGLVLARSGFHHSMNYRSVVLFSRALVVDDPDEKARILQSLSEHLVPGRWREVRVPTLGELNATSILSMAIDEASAKVRTGPPVDDEEDYALPVWAGVLPLTIAAGAAVPCPRLSPGIDLPSYVGSYPGPGEGTRNA